jgi:hypothetical protein
LGRGPTEPSRQPDGVVRGLIDPAFHAAKPPGTTGDQRTLSLVSWKTRAVTGQLTKWSITNGTVIRHVHYGLRVQIPSGEIGVVVRDHIGDSYVAQVDWPAIGSVVTVVGGGYAGSQLRLSTRPSHLEQARARAASDRDTPA